EIDRKSPQIEPKRTLSLILVDIRLVFDIPFKLESLTNSQQRSKQKKGQGWRPLRWQMNSQPTKRPHPERMRPFFPMVNKNPSPVSDFKNSAQVSEQRQRPTNYADPGQDLVLEPFGQ